MQKSGLALAAMAILLVGAEFLARRCTTVESSNLWIELLADCSFKDSLVRDRADFSRRAMSYFDYWLFAPPPFRSSTINFTDHYSSRRVPASAPEGEGDTTVWFFGGSAMQNTDAPDELTIANFAAIVLTNAGVRATVVNFGVGSFNTSLELIKFQDLLRRSPPERRPSVVVFYDGYNDAYEGFFFGPGNMQGDLSRKLEAVVTKRFGRYLVARISEALSARSVLWARYAHPRVTRFFLWRVPKEGDDVLLRDSVAIYRSNVRMVRATCREFGIKPLFVLQPALILKSNRTEFEDRAMQTEGPSMCGFIPRFYEGICSAMVAEDDFLDCSRIFDGSSRSDFYDACHIGPWSSVAVGRVIGERLLPLVKD